MRAETSGLEITTEAPAAAAAIEAFEAELLIYGRRAAVVFDAVAADPGCALGHALAAAAYLFALSPDGARRAAPHISAASQTAGRTSPREQMLIGAIADWSAGRIDAALVAHNAIATRWPRDLLSAKIAQFHQLNRGDFAGMRRMTGRLLEANGDRSHVLGMHAFALEQTGDGTAAEAAGRRASAAAFDPWAQHAVAHVLDTAGRAADGVRWMAAHADGWDRCSSFMYTHNWWHSALFELERDNASAALALYDSRVWGVRPDYAQDQINAVSLLARLEIHGVDVGERWNRIAAHLADRTSEHINAFVDLHYLYGLARAGCEAAVAAMLSSLRDHAARSTDPAWRFVAPVAAEALVAHASGRYRVAAERLDRVRSRLVCIGGSHTQRDLFELIHLDSLIRSRGAGTPAAVERRLASRGGTAWLARLHAGMIEGIEPAGPAFATA